MSMENFRRMAAKIEQHMQQLAVLGVENAPEIFNRMMGYVPDLQSIHDAASDKQLMALSSEFPEFYRYARIVEDAFEAERKKVSRPYDDYGPLSEGLIRSGEALMTMAATLERGYQSFLANGRLQEPRVLQELDKWQQQWLDGLERYKQALRAEGVDTRALATMEEVYGRFTQRIAALAHQASVVKK